MTAIKLTIKELIEKSTHGPYSEWWYDDTKKVLSAGTVIATLARGKLNKDTMDANGELIARCSPEVMALTADALQDAVSWLEELAEDGNSAGWVIEKHTELAGKINAALSALNGHEPDAR